MLQLRIVQTAEGHLVARHQRFDVVAELLQQCAARGWPYLDQLALLRHMMESLSEFLLRLLQRGQLPTGARACGGLCLSLAFGFGSSTTAPGRSLRHLYDSC